MAMSDSYKEPEFTLISKNDNIEIRQYDKYVIARTSISKTNSSFDNSMFSVLAGYIFGGNKKIHDHISKVTSSGTVCINDVMLPVLIPNLPFGGVGKSGMGKFHGEEGFKNFSNQKSITYKGFLFDLNLRYPPYDKVMKIIKFIFKI